MLTKLMKYDLRASFRYLWMLYAAVVAVAALSGLSFRMDTYSGIAIVFSMLLLGLLGIAVVVLTIVQIIAHFYRNLIKGEGYLMHTLPVHTWQLVASKLLTSVLVCIATFLAAVLAGIAFFFASGMHVIVKESLHQIGEFFMLYDLSWKELILSLLSLLASLISSVMVFYAALSLGQLANQHRLAMSFVFYLVIKTVISVISSVIGIMTMRFEDSTAFIRFFSSVTVYGIIYALLISAVCFVITELVLRKKLNLE